MFLLHEMLKALANFFSNTGFWLTMWVIVLVGFSVFIVRMSRPSTKPRPWVLRKGVCPFCDSDLFGTTHEYQRLYLLASLSPESKYLCTNCDKEKISGLLSKLG